jgi:hypothetical protein
VFFDGFDVSLFLVDVKSVNGDPPLVLERAFSFDVSSVNSDAESGSVSILSVKSTLMIDLGFFLRCS